MKPMFKSWSILAALMLLLTSSGLMAQTNNEAPSTSTFSLKEAQDYAVKNSFNVKSVRHDAKAAELQTKELTGIGLPQLNGSVQYQNFIDLPTSIVPGEFFGAPGQDIKLQFPCCWIQIHLHPDSHWILNQGHSYLIRVVIGH